VRLLLLYTARPEFRAQWPLRAHHIQINLNRLSARDIRTMVQEVAARKALSDETIATVVERTGGVPLFVEELTRAVLESGSVKPSGREIPATLHDSLMARLDRLGPAKEIIQIGAVIGGEFSYELLHAVHPVAEENLQRALHNLADAELIYVRGIAPDATYEFKHALIRDAAYEALLKSRRKELHRMIARAIDEKFPVLKESQPEVLARHWTEAGEPEPGLEAWRRAGERAVARGAYREAEQHYLEASDALSKLPESAERDARELTLRIAVGDVLMATKGYSSEDTSAVYARARVLAERKGGPESMNVLNGLWSSAVTRDDLKSALALADQMLIAADAVGTDAAFVAAHYAQAHTRHMLGDLICARRHFLEVRDYYKEKDFRGNPIDPGISSLSWAAPNEWHLGNPWAAIRLADEAIALARRVSNSFGLAFAVSVRSHLDVLSRNVKLALADSAAAMRLGTELSFPVWTAIGKLTHGWARAQLRASADVIESIREGIAELNEIGFSEVMAIFLGMLAEAQARAGETDPAFATIESALETNPDEMIFHPNLLRLRADLRLSSGRDYEHLSLAECDLRNAIQLARQMHAKSDELRATASLTRLLATQRRHDEARSILTEIYNWFTEGSDTADLKDAKALLDELAT
jgi:tetratricopeptide (TPR) repeat protein